MITLFLASPLLRFMHDRSISRWTFAKNKAVKDYFVSIFFNASEYQMKNNTIFFYSFTVHFNSSNLLLLQLMHKNLL
jgi:hypothetical protein